MTILNDKGYITRRIGSKKNPNAKGSHVDWFIVRDHSPMTGCISLRQVQIPAHLIGRRVRFKLELVDQ